jgi:hypothetical protein
MAASVNVAFLQVADEDFFTNADASSRVHHLENF